MKQQKIDFAEFLSGRSHQMLWIPVERLEVVWPKAQRDLTPQRVRDILSAFDPDVLGTLIVLKAPDGRLHVADGWARRNAVIQMFGPDTQVPCIVMPCANEREAAHIFNRFNGTRTKPTALQMFGTGLAEGTEMHTAVAQIVARARLHIGTSETPGAIRAVGAVMAVYKQYGADGLRDTLWLIKEAWGDDPTNFEAALVRGFAMFLAGNPETPPGRLAGKIARRHTAARMLGSARATREAFKGSMANAVCALLQDVDAKRQSRPSPKDQHEMATDITRAA